MIVGLALDLVQAPDAVIFVREQSEFEALVLRLGPVVTYRVERHSDDAATSGREVGRSVTQLSTLDRTTGGTCFRIPPQERPPSAERLQ